MHRHLGFTPGDIKENNRLIIELCKKVIDKVDYIMVPIISPFRESREEARKNFGKEFVEIYINCSPYEPPKNSEIEIDSVKQKPEEAVKKIIDLLGFNFSSLYFFFYKP